MVPAQWWGDFTGGASPAGRPPRDAARDEAIQGLERVALDCFAAVAMTAGAHFPAFAGCPIPRGTGTNPTWKGSNRHETNPRCCWTCIADHKLCVGSIRGQLRPNKTGRGPVRIRGCARARHADLRCRRGPQWRQMSRPWRRARRARRETPPGEKASLEREFQHTAFGSPPRTRSVAGRVGGGHFLRFNRPPPDARMR
jgi:hypothetical protein